MLNRGRSVGTLSGLRQRLANLFLQFIETPDFNPEATRFLKVCRRHLKFFHWILIHNFSYGRVQVPPVGGDGRRLLSTTM